MKFGFRIAPFPRLQKKYPKSARRATVDVLRIVAARMESAVVKNTPTGVGGEAGLRGSIAGQVFGFGNPVRATVGTPLEYGEAVEHGTKPHFPPVSPIELWVKRKLGLSDDEARSVAFAIAIKISKKGTKGAHMFENAFAELDPWIMKQINTIPDRIAKDF